MARQLTVTVPDLSGKLAVVTGGDARLDRNGVIRRILTGWDTGNAARIPALLNALLAERPAHQTP